MNFTDNSNLGRKTKSGGRNTEAAFGGIYTDNLIKSTCFYLKSIRIHEFFLNLSQICMFCDDNSSKLATESTHSGVP